MDEQHPGWHRKIDLHKLFMGSDCLCVLGQLTGSFYAYTLTVKEWQGDHYMSRFWKAEDFGFSLSRDPRRDYNWLTKLWVDEIHKRLSADSAEP